MSSSALGKICASCGVERKKKGVLYHPETFMPYCHDAYFCNDDHPNAIQNVLDRGGKLELIPFEEAQSKFHNWVSENHPDKDIADKIKRMVKQPITLRIGNPELAQFILELQHSYGFNSVSDTIRYCIEQVKNMKGDAIISYSPSQMTEEAEEVLEDVEDNGAEMMNDVSEQEPEEVKEEEKPEEEEDFGTF